MADRELRYILTAEDRGAAAAMGRSADASEQMSKRIVSSLSRVAGIVGGELEAGFNAVIEGFSKLGEEGTNAGEKLQAVGAGVATLGLALVSMGANEKRTTDQLKTAISDTGRSYDEFAGQIEKATKKNEDFGFSTEDTMTALTRLTEATQDPQKALDNLQLVTDLAASKHESLASAAQQVAKILSGSGGKILHQYGITMQTNADGTKNVDLALQQLSQRLQGQAAASVDNFNGRLDIVITKLKDWAASIGEKIGPALTFIGTVVDIASNSLSIYEAAAAKAAAADAARATTTEAVVASNGTLVTSNDAVVATNEAVAESSAAAAAGEEAVAAAGTGAAAGAGAAAAGGAAAGLGFSAMLSSGLRAVPVVGSIIAGTLALGAGLKATGLELPKIGGGMFDFANSTKSASHGMEDITDSLRSQLVPAMNDAQSTQGGFIDQMIQTELQSDRLTGLLDGTGMSVGQVTTALTSSPDAWNSWITNLEKSMLASGRNKDQVEFQVGSIKDLRQAWQDSADEMTHVNDGLSAQDKFLKANNLTLATAAQKYNDARAQAFSFTAQLGYMSKALDDLSNNQIGAKEGQLKLTDAWDTGKGADSALTKQVHDHGASLDENTAKGRSNIEFLLDQITQINAQAVQQAKATGSIDKGTASLGINTKALLDSAGQAGFTRADVQKLIDTYGATPDSVKTSITEQGAAAVEAALGDLEYWLHRIADPAWAAHIDIVAGAHAAQGGKTAPAAAAGGLLMGAGGPTSDNLLIRASPGEYVVNAAATAANLPYLDSINNSNRIKAFAAGGLVGNLNLTEAADIHVDISDAEQQARSSFISSIPGAASGNLGAWIAAALAITGTPADWAPAIGRRIMFESGGNPNAINNWDINAQRGDPSRGLMQTIGATFAAYHQSGTSDNIYDPVANIAAAINYIKANYGSIFAIDPPVQGYGTGNWDVARDEFAYLHEGEMVLPEPVAERVRTTAQTVEKEATLASHSMATLIADAVAKALSGAHFRFDADGLATMITAKQTAYAVRGGRR